MFFELSTLFFKSQIHFHKGVHLIFFSSIFAACGSIVNALLVKDFLTPAQVTFINMFGQATVLFFAVLIKTHSLSSLKAVFKRSWYITLLATILEAGAYIALNQAYKIGLAAAVTAIYMAMSITIVWIGIVFLKEKDHIVKKILSSLIVTAGILLVTLYS